MTTQVVNALFHIFFSFYYSDFSPGTVTAVLLYLPINYLIFNAALNEGYVNNIIEIGYIFVLGATTFALFEIIGPKVMLAAFILSIPYYLHTNYRDQHYE